MLNSLHIAQSGLNASRVSVENVMNNISNENTPGYKKRIVGLTELSQIDNRSQGRGVSVNGVTRSTDIYLQHNIYKEGNRQSGLDKLNGILTTAEAVFKETDVSGFSYDLDRYFQSVENLRSNPHNEIYKNDVVTQASVLVTDLQNLYSGIEDIQSREKLNLKDDVDRVNGIIKEIADINDQITKRVIPPNDLYDKRDQLELELSKFGDIKVEEIGGDYNLKFGNMTVVSLNTNTALLSVKEEYSPQVNKFADDSNLDNIFDGKTFDTNDKVTLKLDNKSEVSVTFGESIAMDWNGDGTVTTETVDSTNYIRALRHKVNNSTEFKDRVIAYNGDYSTDTNGNKVESLASDNFLRLESRTDGEIGAFEAYIHVTKVDNADPTNIEEKFTVNKNEVSSKKGTDSVFVEVFDEKLELGDGSLKVITDNLTTESPNNRLVAYKDKLDLFATTLVDLTAGYVANVDGSYKYGGKQSELHTTDSQIKELGLFSGSSVKTLQLNKEKVLTLNQENLDYLASLQWKADISFDGKPQDGTSNLARSFTKYFEEIRVDISTDKESIKGIKETQDAVVASLTFSYEKITKVDKDEEMLNLIKFQKAYEANAKMINVVDEMLETILGLKR